MLINKKPNGEVVIIDKVKEVINCSNVYQTIYHIKLESNITIEINSYPNIKKGTKLKVWGKLNGDYLRLRYGIILNPQKKLLEFIKDNDNALGNVN